MISLSASARPEPLAITDLFKLLMEAKIPIDGISESDKGQYRVDYSATATKDDIIKANNLISSWSGVAKKIRPIEEVITAVSLLDPKQLQQLQFLMMADYLVVNVDTAKTFGIDTREL